jgi:transposase InsO family protein
MFDKCLPLLQSKAWWHSYRSDLFLFIKCCHKCGASCYVKRPPHQANLRPTRVGGPGERWAIDLTGRHPLSNGCSYILTAIDVFSKYLVAVPIREKTAECVARVLMDRVFLVWGLPFEILSDQGTEFMNAVLQELMRLLGVKQIRTSAYAPSTNGVVERTHRCLNSMLSKVISDHQRDWSYYVPYVCFSFNNTLHRSTGFTPFYVYTGREANWRVDLLLGDVNANELEVPEYTREVVQRLQYTQQLVREKLDAMNAVMSTWYNREVKECSFDVGQKVRVFQPQRVKGRSPKWTLFFSSIAEVLQKINDATYLIKFVKGGRTVVVHVDKLKPYLEYPVDNVTA